MSFYSKVYTPIGELTLLFTDMAVTGLLWESLNNKELITKNRLQHLENSIFKQAKKEILEYFEGKRKDFTVPVAPKGTPFQLEVWKKLQEIPFGQTISYSDLAKRVGRPNASRAVGGANGKNPIGLIIPCHRVIGKNGKLTGFNGGVDIKSQLIAHEE